jgi:hypothetical protein
MVHHVVWSARLLLCSEVELFGLLSFIRWRIPNCALVCRFSQRVTSTEPSNFCTLDCGRQYLSILVVARFQSLEEWALCLGRLIDPFSRSLNPSQRGHGCNSPYMLDVFPCLDFVAFDTFISAGSSWQTISIVMLQALAMLGPLCHNIIYTL